MPLSLSLSPTRAPRRVAPLAVLPVFVSLAGRKALVAGGSAAAAWKAELLAAAGAEVHVRAGSLDPVFERLIASQCGPGRFVHEARTWTKEDFTDAAIAVCDADSEAEAMAFAGSARAAGVPVNVIDKPDFCGFQFGCVVNRSPAVVATSTDGAAPILAQAIRRRIETLLPHSLADWAALAQGMRAEVARRLAPGQERRAFWERFVDLAFGPAPDAGAADRMIGEAQSIAAHPGAAKGRVTLVGAGPGDPELLTLKAVRALQAADVILFDDLVSDEVLELARREAKRMLVGKRGGRESCRQEDINQMMVSLARAGKHVVRLKGGDPMIFGRAGEEIERLEGEGIPVEVVPGITSALGMAARLGVSLTHRDHARSVRFVTGHSRSGELPADIDWRALTDPASTTIFYMGGRTVAGIADALTANGMPLSTPIVVAMDVSRPGEKHWAGTLDRLVDAVAAMGCEGPVLIGIGRVFGAAVRQSIPSTIRVAA